MSDALPAGASPSDHVPAPRFPALGRVFSGYLHEDFAAEYGSPEAALRAFRDDASPEERRRVQRETKRLAAIAHAADFDEVRALMQRLGSRWMPPSREALVAPLNGVSGSTESTGR